LQRRRRQAKNKEKQFDLMKEAFIFIVFIVVFVTMLLTQLNIEKVRISDGSLYVE
jgi:hypothetical protein